MSPKEIIDYLLRFEEHLSIAKYWSAILRDLVFATLKGMGVLVDMLSRGLTEMYSLIDFTYSKVLEDFIEPYEPVIWLLMTLAVAFLGWKIIIQGKVEMNKYVTNTIIALTIFLLMPWALKQAAGLVTSGVDLLNNEKSASFVVFQNNITDIYAIDKNGWKSTEIVNSIENKQTLKLMDISEVVDTGGILFDNSPLSDKGKDILSKQYKEVNGEIQLANLKSHFIAKDEAYFRYSWKPLHIFLELGIKLLVYFFALFKTAKIIMEIGVLQMLTQGIALTDIGSGQRNKQMVTKIRDSFIVLYLIMFMVNSFDLWSKYIADANVSWGIQIVAIIAGGWLVIDGPNFIEQLFGIDSGLSSISRGVIAMTQGAKFAKDALSGGINTAKNLANMGAKTSKAATKGLMYASAGLKGALSGFEPSSGTSPIGNENSNPMLGAMDGETKSSPSKQEIPAGMNVMMGMTNKLNAMKNDMKNPLKDITGGSQIGIASPLKNENGNENNSSAQPKDTQNRISFGGLGKTNNGSTNPLKDKNGNENSSPIQPKDTQNRMSFGGLGKTNNGSTNPLKDKNGNENSSPIQPKDTQNKMSFGGLGKKDNESTNSLKGKKGSINNSPIQPKDIQNKTNFQGLGKVNVPDYIKNAHETMMKDTKPRVPDKETLGDKAMNKYASLARKTYDSKPMRNSRKIYDVSKATASKLRKTD